MNTKRIFIAILLLVGLTLSGCFLPPPPSGGRGYGYYGYSHSDSYYNHGYDRPYGDRRDSDRGHRDSGRGSRHWR
jgi:hypothetical protein